MKSLFRGLEERKREEIVKANLIQELRKTAKEMSNEHLEEGVLRSVETSNSLCTSVEAIFIHGLKETLVSKFSSVMGGPDQVPEPEFWSLILVFSHRDIIQQIQKFTQITTDIGRSRAWIRLVLNDALLRGYIESISVQNSALNPYYKKTAFLRDLPMLHNFLKEIKNIANVNFEYPTNSCFLNYWPTPPLLMAGLWTPPIKFFSTPPERTDEATDLAAELADEVEIIQDRNSYTTIEQPILYDEDEALKIILGTPVQDSLLKTLQDNKLKSAEALDSPARFGFNTEISGGQEDKIVNTSDVELQVESKLSDMESQTPKNETEGSYGPGIPPSLTDRRESNTSESYDLLLKNYNPVSTCSGDGHNNLQDILKESYDSLLKNYNPVRSSPKDSPTNTDSILQTYDMMTDAFSPVEAVPDPQMSASLLIERELKSMVKHLGKLMLESGLISQHFLCKKCNQHIGISFASPRVCAFTGHYYCAECFGDKESVIPARILHNWDFSKHPVCVQAYAFLSDVEAHPLIDIRAVNPKLYLIVPEMEVLQRQRMKLNLLRMYVMTCRNSVLESLKKRIWPRDYLYEHIHLYSISDLIEIPSSVLTQTLKEVIQLCENHVIGCNLCSQKGFICEICNSKQIIFPFHLESTYRCPKCCSVVHNRCKAEVQGCPKCLRIQKRSS